MRCVNCNSEVEDSANFCRYCGAELNKISNDDNKDNSLEEKCIKAYVGENKYDSFFRPFNVYAFFLGPIYLLYRKMYLYTFLYFAVLLFVSFFAIFANLVLAFVVNSMYLSKVKTDVRNIIRVNKNKTDEEIIDICIKKGGTSFTAVIIYLVVASALSAFSWWGINKIIEYDEKNNLKNEYTKVDNELKYKVPSGFIKNSDNNYSSYTNTHRCYIYISKSSKEYFLTETEYLERYYSNKSLEKKTINNNIWYLYVDNYTSTSNNYFINISGNDVFKVKYYIASDDDKYCSRSLDEFSSTFKIVDKSGTIA